MNSVTRDQIDRACLYASANHDQQERPVVHREFFFETPQLSTFKAIRTPRWLHTTLQKAMVTLSADSPRFPNDPSDSQCTRFIDSWRMGRVVWTRGLYGCFGCRLLAQAAGLVGVPSVVADPMRAPGRNVLGEFRQKAQLVSSPEYKSETRQDFSTPKR